MSYCRNCGTELKEAASFCQNCGTPVARPAVDTERPKQTLPKTDIGIQQNGPVLSYREYFEQLASEEMRTYTKKMTFHTLLWGILPLSFMLVYLIVILPLYNAIFKEVLSPKEFTLVIFILILSFVLHISALILSALAIKKGERILSIVALVIAMSFGSISLASAIISLVATTKLYNWYKTYLTEKEGVRY